FDFAITAFEAAPQWIHEAVVYQIFPDRFARSGREYELPEWAVAREWNQVPEGRSKNTVFEYFGGDVWGIAEKLDYLQELGVNVVYMTPTFPAGSTHRYDAQTFESVDPLLGGDEALIHLTTEAHKRGMKVIGDITLNHCGVTHEWFQTAEAGHPVTSEFFTFNPALPHGYECWLGVHTLPKFDYRSQALRERLITGPHSVIRKWLKAPFELDGWRVDVANMSGRQGDIDLTHEVAQMTRHVVMEEGDDKILIAEHFHDAGSDLNGDGWHGGMNYAAFMRPVWTWLVGEEFQAHDQAAMIPLRSVTGQTMVETINDFSARMPWRSRMASWTVLCSHDTPRIRSVVGDANRHEAALGMLVGMPGTPMVFMGDELGATGLWGEVSRSTMPWDDLEAHEPQTQAAYRALLNLRRESDALARGGLRWLAIGDDAVAFARESQAETLVFVVSREAGSFDLDLARINGKDWQQVFGAATLDSHSGTVSFAAAGTTVWRIV
ncbi:MAG: hypothetical protein RLZZ426_198, partial [Actinomycetota bacterium]